jgi:hypothetical protein
VSLEIVLQRLDRLTRSGAGWTARCPAHEDRHNSLSVSEGAEGRVLLHCFAGCSTENVCEAIGLELRDLFAPGDGRGALFPRRVPAPPQHTGCTLEAYAEAKGLPAEFLRSLGLSEITYQRAPAVRMPYFDEAGNELTVRFRVSLDGDQKVRTKRGCKAHLYGLNRLEFAREAGYVVLVEGESCAQTAWLHGFPALGLPGANAWKEERDAGYLEGISAVYVLIEPDRGGDAVLRWLSASRISERVRLVRLLEVKDVSELYLADRRQFAERFEVALQSAVPWAEQERVAAEIRTQRAWDRASPLASRPRILDEFEHELERAGVVGERRNAKLLYLALTSRLLARPVSVVVKGPSSGGKSYTVESVCRFFPAEAYYPLTAMSERALAYGTEPLRHRFLVLYEAAGLESDFASYLMRSLLSEGRLRYETVEKGPNGLAPRMIERDGPTGLIVTTTAISLHPENETRLVSLTVTDTPEQTRGILFALASEPAQRDLSGWQALQIWLAGAERRVHVPFAAALAEAVPPVAVRLRRDFAALLTLVRAHALLHQTSRDRDPNGNVIATVEDYGVVHDLVAELFAEGVEATVPATVRETVEAVSALADDDGISLVKLATALNVDKSSASRRWSEARRRGYLRNLEDRRGKPARIVVGEPLPNDVEILPPASQLEERCGIARVPEQGPAPPDPGPYEADGQ